MTSSCFSAMIRDNISSIITALVSHTFKRSWPRALRTKCATNHIILILTNLARVTHISVRKLSHRWFGAMQLSEQMMDHCKLDPGEQTSNKHVYRNSIVFLYENAFENVIWKTEAILSQPQCINLGCIWKLCKHKRNHQKIYLHHAKLQHNLRSKII